MPRQKAPTAAVQPAKGKKITFGDDDDLDNFADEAGPSTRTAQRPVEADSSDDDDDDAPEAVGVGRADDDVSEAAELLAQQSRARKEAARLRNQKIAESRASKRSAAEHKVPTKGKGKSAAAALGGDRKRKGREVDNGDDDDEDDDEDTKRLKRRMEAAMAQGDETDSEMELSEGEEGSDGEDDGEEDELEEDESEDAQSFHTDSEAEDEDEDGDDDDDDDDDDSERLEDEGPIDDKTRQLRARMQAMMEAAEARARGDDGPQDRPSSKSSKPKSALKTPKSTAAPPTASAVAVGADDEEAGYDLAPMSSMGKPLPAAVLRRAEEAEKAKKAAKEARDKAAKAGTAGSKSKKARSRKKQKVEPTTRIVSEKKALHILPPTHAPSFSNASLPPIIEPGTKVGMQSKAQKGFYKKAMKTSGVKPGQGIMDGRKKLTVAR